MSEPCPWHEPNAWLEAMRAVHGCAVSWDGRPPCYCAPLPVARVRAPWWRRALAWLRWRGIAMPPATERLINEGTQLEIRVVNLTPYASVRDDGRPPPTAMPGPGVPSPR